MYRSCYLYHIAKKIKSTPRKVVSGCFMVFNYTHITDCESISALKQDKKQQKNEKKPYTYKIRSKLIIMNKKARQWSL